MKLKHVLLTAVALCCCIGLSAQRQKASNWNNVIEDIPVEYEFSYITGKTGAILDGPFKMYRHEEKEGPYKIYWRVSGIWSYKLTGSHTNGKLNGPISLTYIQKATATNGEKSESTQTLKGNFLNGVPNGNFVADYGKDSFGRSKYCNVTYKNGKLIGKYVTKGYTGSNNEYMEISGTLTSAGKMTGTSTDPEFTTVSGWSEAYTSPKDNTTILIGAGAGVEYALSEVLTHLSKTLEPYFLDNKEA